MKVLVVDDHWISRVALKPLIAEIDRDAECLEAQSFGTASGLIAENPDLDLIILDLLLPDMDVGEGLRSLHGQAPQVPIVAFSMVENRHEVLRTVEMGVAGYIPKASTGEEIVKALEQVLAGELYLPRMLLKESGQKSADFRGYMPLDAAPRQAIANLTDRQRQVLSFLAQGMTNTKIAKELGLSENTVRIHISAILRALDLDNRTQAALLAAQYLRTATAI